MKKLIFMTIVFAFLVSPVLAGPIVKVYWGAATQAYRSGDGGEFTAEPTTGWPYDPLTLYSDDTKDQAGYQDSFQTFCLEVDEDLDLEDGHEYGVIFNQNAVQGGVGGGGSGDPISKGTAWLYYQFASKNVAGLTGYEYDESTGNRDDDAVLLQEAIWALEDEIANPAATTNEFFDLAVAHFGSILEAEKDNAGLFGVQAMNLYGSITEAQDILVLVPVPAAVLLGMIGLSVAGIKLRKYA